MAIKRSTKGRGTPLHKPAASAPLRHVAIRPPQQMVSGERYVGWQCRNRACGKLIAIGAAETPDRAADVGDQLTAIRCPHCGDENLYHWNARSEQPCP